MSNYYIRENGDWFVKHGKDKIPIEFSVSMEIAYLQGKNDAIQEVIDNLGTLYSMNKEVFDGN